VINGRKLAVVMPAYNAERTLERTYRELPLDIVDIVIVVDDASRDRTVDVARSLGCVALRHDANRGYGANQKTCYAEACRQGADIVVMVHPDYQYTPKLLRAMASLIAEDVYDVVLGSRILGMGALRGGMPRYKYVANRFLTLTTLAIVPSAARYSSRSGSTTTVTTSCLTTKCWCSATPSDTVLGK
jgi:glycosyltransferase involved in cell wall biosynthesis